MPTTPSRAVLLVTHSADHFTIDRVQAGVARRGGFPLRLDSDRFPAHCRLTTRVGAEGVSVRMRTRGIELPVESIVSVWMRRIFDPPRPGSADGADGTDGTDGIDDAQASHCVRESRAALDGFLSALAGATWLDPPNQVRRAENKLLQLRLARDAGLRVPQTVVTNDPDEVRGLWDACRGRMIAKMLTPAARSMAGGPAVYTTALTAADLDDLDGLALSPMVFQERIDKLRELRVVYVGGRCFVGSLAADRDDWRAQPAGPASPWQIDALPDDVAGGLHALMRALGLGFGAADFLRARDGGYVFLEVNPVGEWGMLERDLGLPIADAIAEELCQR